MSIYEEPLGFDVYDEATLAIVCPVCCAARTGKCLEPKPGGSGGTQYMDEPHPERVAQAHGRKQDSIWGE